MGRDLPAIAIILTAEVTVAIPVITVPVAVAVVPSISPRRVPDSTFG